MTTDHTTTTTAPEPGPRPLTYDAQLIADGQCPELVPVMTEDGPSDGRCLAPIVTVTVPPDPRYGETEAETVAFACEGHSAEILGWRAMSEVERIAWERRQDAEASW
jgi:hypothetical protein